MTIIYNNIYAIKYTYSLLGTLVLLCSCFSLKSGPVINQGLSGYIYLVTGNQMPSPGRPQSNGHGVSRKIYVYEQTSLRQTQGVSPVFDQIRTKLIATTNSDSSGHYSIKLPAGAYSVFIEAGHQFFAAESNGTGILSPVEIIAKTVTHKDFKITINAAY